MPADGSRGAQGAAWYMQNMPARVGGVDELAGDMEFVGYDEVSGAPVFRAFRRRGGPPQGGRGFSPPMVIRPRCPQGGGGDDEEVGGEDDVLGADDLDELGAIDDEIGDIEGDDEEALGADGQENIGATVKNLERKEARLRRLLLKLEAKLAQTPRWKGKKRKALQKRIDRIEARLGKVSGKKEAKVESARAVYGKAPQGLKTRPEANVERLRTEAQMGVERMAPYDQIPGVRQNIHMTDADDGAQAADVSFAAAAGFRTSTINFTSPQISYERVKVLGVRFDISVVGLTGGGAAALDVWPALLLSSVQRDGMADQVTATTWLKITWNPGLPGGRYEGVAEWYGARDTIYLDKRDVLTIICAAVQKRTNAAQIDWTVSAEMICDILADSQ